MHFYKLCKVMFFLFENSCTVDHLTKRMREGKKVGREREKSKRMLKEGERGIERERFFIIFFIVFTVLLSYVLKFLYKYHVSITRQIFPIIPGLVEI